MADLLAPSTPAQEQPAAAVDPLVKAELMDVDESAPVSTESWDCGSTDGLACGGLVCYCLFEPNHRNIYWAIFEMVSFQVPQQNGVPLRPDPEVETVISPGDTTTSNQNAPKSKHTLADLPQGQVGKLQLLKSGRVRLKLNGTSPDKPLIFDAAPGTSTAFLQVMKLFQNVISIMRSLVFLASGQHPSAESTRGRSERGRRSTLRVGRRRPSRPIHSENR